MRAFLTKRDELAQLTSASALERVGAFWYIVADDSPELYRLDNAFQIVGTTRLLDTNPKSDERIAKESKPDLEALTSVEWICPVERANALEPVKIEGLAPLIFSAEKKSLVAVTDADEDTSEVLAIEIE